ncbi:MAG: hypothetical protein WCA59_07445 [Candidatus Binataceae bacterium]
MAAQMHSGALDPLIREILSSAGRDSRKLAAGRVEKQFHSAARQDYARQLRALFDRQEMRELFADFRSALPALNADVFRIREPSRLAAVAADLGARFRASRFEGEDGKSLRGFYIDDPDVSKGPLICVNTACHPVAVASAFWHELGHHLTSRTFDVSYPVQLQLSFSSTYEDHLGNPLEIAADILATLAAYPKPVAQRLFRGFVESGAAPNIESFVLKARAHVRSVSGFDFRPGVPATENLRYLAGMMHFIRLRWVLLSEYEI